MYVLTTEDVGESPVDDNESRLLNGLPLVLGEPDELIKTDVSPEVVE